MHSKEEKVFKITFLPHSDASPFVHEYAIDLFNI